MTQIDDVKNRTDIVELVSGYVNLQRSGTSLKANCPFHQERTPSFHVFPDRQSWRCYGACAEGGDVFNFIMKMGRIEFPEALQTLANRAGISLSNSGETGGLGKQLFEINDAARRFFQGMLNEPEAAFVREYLDRRGISARSIQTFEIGYSPRRDNRLLAHLRHAGYDDEMIARARLSVKTDDGRYYDFFRGRLMIPIRDWQARVAGFGSRALDEQDTPKYLNTGQTPVFDKSRILFAMHLAKEPVRQRGAVVVEGYMDAITAHQYGYDNVVAQMGTALTEHQVALIRRLTGSVTMALDGDPAGRNATLRSLESSWGVFQNRNARRTAVSALQQPEALELRVAELPGGQDPDDFIKTSPEAWPAFIEQAQELFDYLLTALSERADISSPDGRSWIAQTMLRFVAQIPDRIRSDLYLDRLSGRLDLNTDTLRAALRDIGEQLARERREQSERASANEDGDESGYAGAAPRSLARDHDAVEEAILAFLLQHGWEPPDGASYMLSPDWFSRSENREIYRNVIAGADSEELRVAPELQAHLESLRFRELRLAPTKRGKAWRQMSLQLERQYLKNEIKQLSGLEEIAQDLDSPLAQRWLDNTCRIGEIDRQLAGSNDAA